MPNLNHDVVEELEAEIERLRAKIDNYEQVLVAHGEKFSDKDAEIERLNALIKADGRVIDENISEIAKLQAVVDALRAELIVQYVEEYGDTEDEAKEAIEKLISDAALEGRGDE